MGREVTVAKEEGGKKKGRRANRLHHILIGEVRPSSKHTTVLVETASEKKREENHSKSTKQNAQSLLISTSLHRCQKTDLLGSKVASQSTSCSAESDTSLFPPSAHWPSMLPTVLNAQQEPTVPWSLTLVTTPLSRQSNESGQ